MLEKTLNFLTLLRNLEKVERTVYRPGDTFENDTEHSYQVAMLAWFLADQFKLSLSKEKLFKYALAHDVVEVYAGDTPVYGSEEVKASKQEREEKSLERIKGEFGYFPDLIESIESYEQRNDEESIFIYELDKLLPPLNMYLDGGYGWNKFSITLEQIEVEKRSKVKNAKDMVVLLEEMLKRFQDEKESLFIAIK
ncbi:MAG: HD domain-containing protein [Patescibacteria group bacterium]